ncbi:MAG: hypothetical protein WBD16_04295 [Pyrinomonadaceae bacterium]
MAFAQAQQIFLKRTAMMYSSVQNRLKKMISMNDENENNNGESRDAIALVAGLGLIGFFVGISSGTGGGLSLRLAEGIGTALALLVVSGIVGFIANAISGKWKVPFLITFVIFTVAKLILKI